jgi:hypothetical protein
VASMIGNTPCGRDGVRPYITTLRVGMLIARPDPGAARRVSPRATTYIPPKRPPPGHNQSFIRRRSSIEPALCALVLRNRALLLLIYLQLQQSLREDAVAKWANQVLRGAVTDWVRHR